MCRLQAHNPPSMGEGGAKRRVGVTGTSHVSLKSSVTGMFLEVGVRLPMA